MKVKAFGDTNVGKVRENNEDNFLIVNIEKETTTAFLEPTEGPVYLVVADGMGGAVAGETASAIVVQSALSSVLGNKSKSPFEINALSILHAQKNCLEMVRSKPEFMGMGSVATYLYIDQAKAKAYVSQVGDTRLYRYRNKTLEQITEDQNFVTELVKMKIITKEQAEFHPQRNAVTQAIGAIDEIIPVMQEFDLQVGDKLLLCSDGLNSMVSDIEIQLILDSSSNLKDIVSILIDTANANGGHDNITVIVVEILE
jgi:protein phosphatase